MESYYKKQAKIFKAFCDEKRQRILELLQNGELCNCVLTEKMNMPQSTLSYHMKILCDSGIVTGREEGKWTYYSINKTCVKKAIESLYKLCEKTSGDADKSICCETI